MFNLQRAFVRVFVCSFFVYLLLSPFLYPFTFAQSEPIKSPFSKRQSEILKEQLMETDREFVRLLIKWLSHRIYLIDKEGKNLSPYLPPAELGFRSFPQKLEDADASYLQIYYAPKDLAAPQTIMYDETRTSLQEYRTLLDEAAPIQILEVPEFIRVVQPDNRPTYSEIWKTIRSYDIDQINAYLFLAQSVFREMPTFQSAYENNQDNLVSLTDSIKKYQKETLLKNAEPEIFF